MEHYTPPSRQTVRKRQIRSYRPSSRVPVRLITTIYFSVILSIATGVVVFTKSDFPIGGVPIPIIRKFLNDETARNAFFGGKSTQLHDRLKEMGIKEEIKAYYRPRIHNEAELDRYIHQIFYERTGYVGKLYRVNSQGILVRK